MPETLYAADCLPVLQNRVYPDRESACRCPTGDVLLAADVTTGIVSNTRFDPTRVVYDASYHNEQSGSTFFREHLGRIADLVSEHVDCSHLVEIGCGKGAFLQILSSRGIDVQGFDPAYEGSDHRIRKELFSADSTIQASGLVLRHVLEHIPDPYGFLCGLRDANRGRGKLYIEVPCLDWILSNRAWFDIFYEHVNYFRLSDFGRMFGSLSFQGRSFGGQYLSVVADLASLRDPGPAEPLAWPADFMKSLAATMQADERAPAVVAWGAASKGVIFSLFRQRHGRPLDGAIDINPAKQHRYLPATGIHVLDPASALRDFPRGTVAWVMNRNYVAEVASSAGRYFDIRCLDTILSDTNGGSAR